MTEAIMTNDNFRNLYRAVEGQLREFGLDEIRRYMKEFPDEVDYNIAQHGNLLVEHKDVYGLFEESGYRRMWNFSAGAIWAVYRWAVGYVADRISEGRNEMAMAVKEAV